VSFPFGRLKQKSKKRFHELGAGGENNRRRKPTIMQNERGTIKDREITVRGRGRNRRCGVANPRGSISKKVNWEHKN